MVDIRHTPTKDDIMMCEWIKQSGIDYVVLASKLDKISRNEIRTKMADIRQTLDIPNDVEVLAYSAKDKDARFDIWKIIETKKNAKYKNAF